METSGRDELVAGIYDAALGVLPWEDLLVRLAEATGCLQTGLEIHDPASGVVQRLTPLCAPEYKASYSSYWGKQVSLFRKTDRFPIGRVFGSGEIFDLDSYRRSAFYNEWWRPQGTGGDTLLANVAADGRSTAILASYKPFAKPRFSEDERRTFTVAAFHVTRAMELNRRLHLVRVRDAIAQSGLALSEVVVVDREGWVLSSGEPALRQLSSAGFLGCASPNERIDRSDPELLRLIETGLGQIERRGTDGTLLRIVAAPLREPCVLASLPMDRPATVLHISAPEEIKRTQSEKLVAAHGLTPAEARVAVEVSSGRGRAAVAACLGIREATVRSHLTAIFDKTGVRRQAELVRLLRDG